MDQNMLNAMPRNEKGFKVRRENFVPGVLYGRTIESQSVQFDKTELETIIRRFGDRARIKIAFDGKESLGIFKEVSRDVVSRKLLHLDIQIVDLSEKLTLSVPVIVLGADALSAKKLILQQNLMELSLTGRLDLIPNKLEIDVSEMEDGDTRVLSDIELPEGIECFEEPDALILSTRIPRMVEEETEEEETEEVTDGEEAKEDEAEPEKKEDEE